MHLLRIKMLIFGFNNKSMTLKLSFVNDYSALLTVRVRHLQTCKTFTHGQSKTFAKVRNLHSRPE